MQQDHTTAPRQAPLPMEFPLAPELERAMRELFERRWCRWHRERSFDEAMRDPITRRLLELSVQHQQRHVLPPAGGRR